MLFGKHKLIPEISPKKTIEGSVGGTLFCAVAFVVYGVILDLIGASVSLNYVALIVGGLLAAIVSQIGDLMFSAIKRSRGIKDYGKIFPGHGGVLDRFDSALAVAVILLAIESCVDLL
jgi:phosphatidate cytidylyltransferase